MEKTNLDRAQELAESKINNTQKYLDAEISVIENVGNYTLFYNFLVQLPNRIKSVVFENFEKKPVFEKSMKDWDDDVKVCFYAGRELYLKNIAEYLENKSKRYTPEMGSSWEDFSECLRGLSKEVLSEI